ncbi:hypothetical protein SAMN05444336_103125 [Albimonas donghaensis]|uniref:Uncharacterized protein n=1 Tax=Albimonas donghaensis TaxID=356660 RepID=A0A1H2YIB7_9RHOB|nr:hypothetical protein [Albimonas donghaensis]SDX04364.1 hypothetical protein SAMN05444336_103125 [Albimonas donghaensis]
MRLSATLLLPLVGLATVWAQAAPPPLFPAPSPDEARIGLAALAESALTATAAGGPLIAPLVADRAPADARADTSWRLRARARLASGPSAGWPAAVYLEASPICETGLDRAECWRLSRLELDGAPLPFDAAAR